MLWGVSAGGVGGFLLVSVGGVGGVGGFLLGDGWWFRVSAGVVGVSGCVGSWIGCQRACASGCRRCN